MPWNKDGSRKKSAYYKKSSGFKMKGFDPGKGTGLSTEYEKNRQIERAKRLARKHVKHTTSDSPHFDESKFEKSEKKMIKADKLLQKAGYTLEQREDALGAAGYKTSMDWAKKKKSSFKKVDDKVPKNEKHEAKHELSVTSANIKKLSKKMNVPVSFINKVIRDVSERSQEYDDFDMQDVKDAVMEEAAGWDKTSD